MKKDIQIPKVSGIGIAITKEIEEGEEIYKSYFVNFNDFAVHNVLVSTRGYGIKEGKQVKTASFRHYLELVPAYSYKLIEPIAEEVLVLNNEFFVTYYIDRLIHDKKYVFLPETITENNFINVEVLNKKGVLIK